MRYLNRAFVKRVENKAVIEVKEIPLNEIHRQNRAGWETATAEEFDVYRRARDEAAAAQKAASAGEAGEGGEPAGEAAAGSNPAVEVKGAKKGSAGK